ncbi:MAG: LysM domain-containing protein, partial [Candidatus Eremiobacterota bacterium]
MALTATKPSPPQPSPAPAGQVYQINKGDTLSEISQKTGHSVKDLARWNDIEDPDKIYAGKTLKLGPADAAADTK